VAKQSGIFSSVNVFFCSFPAAMCELWMITDKSSLFLAAHRYNLGRCSIEEWQLLNRRLENLAKDSRNIVGAVSRYDFEYLYYYTGIKDMKHITSFSGFYTKGHTFRPTKPEILVMSRTKLKQELEGYKGEFVF